MDRYQTSKPYEHPEGYDAKAPVKDLTYDRFIRMLGRGISQVPGNLLEDLGTLAPYSVPGGIHDLLTNSSGEEKLKALADRTDQYWVDPQSKPQTPAEGFWNEAGQWITPL